MSKCLQDPKCRCHPCTDKRLDKALSQLTEANKRIEQWEKTFDDIRMLATYPNQD